MYDKYSERQIIDFGEYTFESNRYEIWKDGQIIKSASIPTSISMKTIGNKIPSPNAIKISLSTVLQESLIAHRMYFDVSYTNGDRVLLAIIASNSNCSTYDSYTTFVAYAPVITRQQKDFNHNEAFACSIFSIDNVPDKISFSLPVSELLIAFYSK